jgi:hypothetical protein
VAYARDMSTTVDGRPSQGAIVRRLGLVAAYGTGVAVMAFAVQTADEGQWAPTHKVEMAHWLETGLWIDPGLMLLGATALMFVALLHAAWRGGGVLRIALTISIPFLILVAAFILYVFEVVLGWHYVNWTSWAPQ